MIERKLLKRLEKENNVKILFAIESGSRAWGFESKDSDYYIRGVYVQDYLTINPVEEQISETYIRYEKEYDICLWDLKKFLRLMQDSNPSCWEWLSSDIVYLEHPIRVMLKNIFISDCNKYKLKKHYISMARQNFNKYINQCSDKANLKKYIYILRCIACVIYIDVNKEPPPKNYKDVIDYLPTDVNIFLKKIIELKTESESLEGPRNREVENYIVDICNVEYIEKLYIPFNINQLNSIFKKYSK
jgi:hypothetical protein